MNKGLLQVSVIYPEGSNPIQRLSYDSMSDLPVSPDLQLELWRWVIKSQDMELQQSKGEDVNWLVQTIEGLVLAHTLKKEVPGGRFSSTMKVYRPEKQYALKAGL